MARHDQQERFTALVNQHEAALYSYIFSIVRNWQDADDLYQTVCLVLWRKFALFQPGSSFFAWARQTAKNTVRDFLRHKRAKWFASDAVLDVLVDDDDDPQSDDTELFVIALRRCREKLKDNDKRLLELRYGEDLGSRQIAGQLQRSQPSVCRSLARIHLALLECVRREVADHEHHEERLP